MNWFLSLIFGSLGVRWLWTVLTFNRREAEERFYHSSETVPSEIWEQYL